MTRLRRLLALAAGAVLLAAAAGCGSGEDAEPFVIGYVARLSGPEGVYDREGLAGARYEAARLSARGGVDGAPIEVRSEEAGLSSEDGAAAARRLLDQGARILLVPAGPDWAAGAVDVAVSAGIPVMSVAGTIPAIVARAGDKGFLAAFGDNVQAAAAAEHARGEGLTRAALVVSPSLPGYTDTVPGYFGAAFAEAGGEIAAEIPTTPSPAGWRRAADRVTELSPPPDVVYVGAFPPEIGGLLRALRAAGYDGAVYAADGAENPALFRAGEAAEGLVLTTHAFAEVEATSGLLFAPSSPAERIARFEEGFDRFHGRPPAALSFAALGADAVAVVQAAAADGGDAGPDALAREIADLDRLEVTSGRTTYRGREGIPRKLVYVLEARDGRFRLLRAIEPGYVPPALRTEASDGRRQP